MKRFEKWIFPICVAIIIAIATFAVSCSHFSMKIGELKDAEVTMDTGTQKE